jgi:hypothetical protein
VACLYQQPGKSDIFLMTPLREQPREAHRRKECAPQWRNEARLWDRDEADKGMGNVKTFHEQPASGAPSSRHGYRLGRRVIPLRTFPMRSSQTFHLIIARQQFDAACVAALVLP